MLYLTRKKLAILAIAINRDVYLLITNSTY